MEVSTGNISTPKKQWYSNTELFHPCTAFISSHHSDTKLKHLDNLSQVSVSCTSVAGLLPCVVCWRIKQPRPPVFDLCPLSLLPLGLFMALILTHVLGRVVKKEAVMMSLEVLPGCCKLSALGESREDGDMKTALNQTPFV